MSDVVRSALLHLAQEAIREARRLNEEALELERAAREARTASVACAEHVRIYKDLAKAQPAVTGSFLPAETCSTAREQIARDLRAFGDEAGPAQDAGCGRISLHSAERPV